MTSISGFLRFPLSILNPVLKLRSKKLAGREFTFIHPSSSAMKNIIYEGVVVGAGPGGLATLAALLDAGLKNILWVDTKFRGGRLNELYREISS